MKYKALFIVVSCMTMASCASPSARKSSKSEYLSGSSRTGFAYSEVARDLSRSESVSDVRVTALPITQALVDSKAREMGRKRTFLNDVDYKQKSCFFITLEAKNIDDSQLGSWQAKIEDSMGHVHKASFQKLSSFVSIPQRTGKSLEWQNSGVACSPDKVSLTKAFKLHVAPKMKHKSAGAALLAWDAPRGSTSEEKSGTTVAHAKSKKRAASRGIASHK